MFGEGLAAQQLVELLAVVSSSDDEESAVRAAVERAAETLEAEIGAVVLDGTVVQAVGLPRGSTGYDALAAVSPGAGQTLDLSAVGLCHVGSAHLGAAGEGILVLARREQAFSVAERNLIRGMARVLGLTLRMLRTLDAERRRQRVMQHLYTLQRAISRRVPLPDVLGMTVAAALDVLANGTGRIQLWLIDAHDTGSAVLACQAGELLQHVEGESRISIADDELSAGAIRADRVHELDARADGRPGWSMAAPVHEHGRTVGVLTVSAERRRTDAERDNLLSFAEHISLALTDAKTQREINNAMHDTVTGLANRALFTTRLRELLVEDGGQGQVTLLFIDLDRFKAVNDTLGHAAGDALLSQVGQLMLRTIRHGDLAGRLGGDEFALALRETSEQDAAVVADRIIEEIARPFPVPGGRAEVGASVGVASSRQVGLDEQELIRRADIAMYQAKRGGRGRHVAYRNAMDASSMVVEEAESRWVAPGGGPVTAARSLRRRLPA
ncbi:sensor domain-containing diguanylate cyclase [Actinoplanes sp. NPDC051411]|uniref:sensor domain-containing diguanylate cyclase n=1 Tax=Actinoplanes sp. NPDC051411 TaxID=3155522 RepID=UPI003427CBD1